MMLIVNYLSCHSDFSPPPTSSILVMIGQYQVSVKVNPASSCHSDFSRPPTYSILVMIGQYQVSIKVNPTFYCNSD